MTRQWRIEFEGAYYHILSRGNERRNIFIVRYVRKNIISAFINIKERLKG